THGYCSAHIESPRFRWCATPSAASGAHDQNILAAVGKRQRGRLRDDVSVEAASAHSINNAQNYTGVYAGSGRCKRPKGRGFVGSHIRFMVSCTGVAGKESP